MGQQIKWKNLDNPVYILKILKKQLEIQSVCEHQIVKNSEQNSVSLVLEIFLKELLAT